MYSVTGRCNNVKQPRGGYVKTEYFDIKQIVDNKELYEQENISGALVGLTVDYLTRFSMGTPAAKAFAISLSGAKIVSQEADAQGLLSTISGLDDKSIIAACRLSSFDVYYRRGGSSYSSVFEITPDEQTISNIRIMVERCIAFWDEYGPVVSHGFGFPIGYTPVISSGDGDYLSETTVWDVKVLRKEPTSQNKLQILVYYLMGRRSLNLDFFTIDSIGIFNPRKNKVYFCPVSRIPKEIRKTVSHDVIGYDWSEEEYEQFKIEESAKRLEKQKSMQQA